MLAVDVFLSKIEADTGAALRPRSAAEGPIQEMNQSGSGISSLGVIHSMSGMKPTGFSKSEPDSLYRRDSP